MRDINYQTNIFIYRKGWRLKALLFRTRDKHEIFLFKTLLMHVIVKYLITKASLHDIEIGNQI